MISRLILFSFIFLLLATSCTINTEKSNEFNRSVQLTGQPNFRDLGNYQTNSGKVLKTGLIYRSGTLAKLTSEDVEHLKSLNIKTVVNFLDEEEREKYGEDQLPDGVNIVLLPIAGQNNEAAVVLTARQTGDFSDVPVNFNYKIHALLTEDGKEAYAQLFHLMANPENYPIVFHCSHGVHRTGTAAALLLSILDVRWETVKQDYLLSNEYRKEETENRIKQLNSLAEKSDSLDLYINSANIDAFYVLKEEYIDGTKFAIEKKYDSFNSYLKSLGVTDSEIKIIQSTLVEK